MATVRVFLPTYRRARLLERAIASLRAQTFTDWICELHNDAPDDDAPGQMLARLGDSRFTLVTHERNLGGTETFNRIFRATAEPFYSMLEDDNWWEPNFLETMLATARAHPAITVFWANMRVWQEQADGSFTDTGRLVWPAHSSGTHLFKWGQPQQMTGALHSHGAALFRSRPGDEFRIPPVPIAVVEMFRERMFSHPIALVGQPLANFSLTRSTARSHDPAEWAETQTMLAATFLKHAHFDETRVAKIWAEARAAHPPTTTTLLLASFAEPSCRNLRHHARAGDWLLLLRGVIRRPGVFRRILRSRRAHEDWWRWLEQQTAARFAETSTSS